MYVNEKIWKRENISISFTLIELLLVISILVILAGLLLPALKRARDTSKTIVCTNNMKQHSTALFVYAGDYNGFIIPTLTTGISSANSYYWATAIVQSLGYNGYWCFGWNGAISGSVKKSFLCPSAIKKNQPVGELAYGSLTYRWPIRLGFTGIYPTFYKFSQIKHPVERISEVDGGTDDSMAHTYDFYTTLYDPFFSFRHITYMNALWLDGHVEKKKRTDVQAYGKTKWIEYTQ